MTNLQWIINHKLNEIVADLCDTALTDYTKEAEIKIEAVKWLFTERIENVQLSENNEQHI